MSRNYSHKFVEAISQAEGESLGLELARACVDSKLPPKLIAKHFGVTRITIHNWFRGGAIRESKKLKVAQFIDRLTADLNGGGLPAKDGKAAKEYIESLQ